MNDTRISFFGLGLIGGSIARAIRANYPKTHIQVYTRRKNPDLEKGMQEGVINSLHTDIDRSFCNCDILFLCAPVLTNMKVLQELKPLIDANCIITDVGSVKGNIHREAARLGMEQNFIGGHPMAGSEKTGYANSSEHLLRHCYYLLTPTNRTSEESLARLQAVLSCTESRFIVLDPQCHDAITAAISHVPHIVAAALVNMVRQNEDKQNYMKSFAAGGFKDITRIASSSPEMWESICLSNNESICTFLDQMISGLTQIKQNIAAEDSEQIRNFFKSASDYRNSIKDNMPSV